MRTAARFFGHDSLTSNPVTVILVLSTLAFLYTSINWTVMYRYRFHDTPWRDLARWVKPRKPEH